MCPPAKVTFMINSMLLWWTLDSVPLPLVIKQKLVKEAMQWGDEHKCKVTSIKPNWQAIWTYNAITSLLLNDTFIGRTTDLEKTVNMNRLLIWLSVTTIADAFLHKSNVWARDHLSPLWRNTQKSGLHTREQPKHPPKVPEKPKFMRNLLSLCFIMHGLGM